MLCKICKGDSTPVFTAKMLGKYDASYLRCRSCGFMQTEDPFWLQEAYASAINEIDLGPVNRAVTGAKLVQGIILSSFNKNGKFVDYGAGYGVLVRLMRDYGFDFYWLDLHCQNIFAKHFVAEEGARYEMLTAFEVFEHLVDPLEEIEKMVRYSDNLLFSTSLVPGEFTSASDWWYFGAEHGQHIAFFTVPALKIVAKRFGLHLATDGSGTHLLSRKPVSSRLFRFFAKETRWSRLARSAMRRSMRKQSLLADDFRAVSGHVI